MIYLEYFLLALGAFIFAIATYHLFRVPDCKRPGIPWSQIHPRADGVGLFTFFFRGRLIWYPQYLTDEGRHHLRVGMKFFIAAMVVMVVGAILGGVAR